MAETPVSRYDSHTLNSSLSQALDKIDDPNLGIIFDLLEVPLKMLYGSSEEFTLLLQRYKTLSEQNRAGTISADEYNLEFRRVSTSLNAFLKEMKRLVGTGIPVLNQTITNQIDLLQRVSTEMLADKYGNIRPISVKEKGNTGYYFSANNVQTGQQVVLKILKINKIEDIPADEFRKLLHLKHRNIIRIVDWQINQLPAYVIMEYVDGVKLDEAIRLSDGLPLKKALNIVAQLAKALDYIRKWGIHHTNIRPSKIYLDYEGVPMISSLDIIKNAKDELRSLNRFREECCYLSPEALNDTLDYENLEAIERSDQFSLGVILLEMLTNEPVFRLPANAGTSGNSINAIFDRRIDFLKQKDAGKRREDIVRSLAKCNLPEGIQTQLIDDILLPMLTPDSAQRLESLTEVLDRFRAIIRELPHETCVAKMSMDYIQDNRFDFSEQFYNNFFEITQQAIDQNPGLMPTGKTEIKDYFRKAAPNPTDSTRSTSGSAASSDNESAFIVSPRQALMLRHATDVILDIEQPYRQEVFKSILQSGSHTPFTNPGLYKYFFEAMKKTVLSMIPSRMDKDAVDAAWDRKIAICQGIVEGVLR